MRAGALPFLSGHSPPFGAQRAGIGAMPGRAGGSDRRGTAAGPARASTSAACGSRASLVWLHREPPSRAGGCRPEAQP
jgi:hypothetical protein